MGGFNVNLLNYESHGETNEFINTMVSHYLLPHILHPTRVTDHSAVVIDNIFSSNTRHETTSGNLTTQISDHFPQFLIINQVFIDYRTCPYAKRDFSEFDRNKFVDGFQIKLWIIWKTLVYQQTENLICFMKWCLLMLTIMSQSKN